MILTSVFMSGSYAFAAVGDFDFRYFIIYDFNERFLGLYVIVGFIDFID